MSVLCLAYAGIFCIIVWLFLLLLRALEDIINKW